MKKVSVKSFSTLLLIAAASLFISMALACTSTLQEDIFDSTETSSQVLSAVTDYEASFIKYDSENISGISTSPAELLQFHSSIETQLSLSREPAVLSQLQSLNGLVYLLENKSKKAQECYNEAKKQQQNNTYILLLNSRLQKSPEESLKLLEQSIKIDSENQTLILEKGKLLYKLGEYDKAIAAIDEALMISDSSNNPQYREYYSNFRTQAWQLYNSQISSAKSSKDINLTANLTKDSMLLLTSENSSLLKDFTAGTKMSTSELTKKLTAYGAFSSALDANNLNHSADQILKSSAITRIMAARFLWNLYVEKKSKPELKTRYSTRYQKISKSPIEDVDVSDEDFDAVMGTVESEIMELPDGKAFFPQNVLSNLDFVTILKNMDK
jgi:tetratricopeptide (TPR) repeat protein